MKKGKGRKMKMSRSNHLDAVFIPVQVVLLIHDEYVMIPAEKGRLYGKGHKEGGDGKKDKRRGGE